MTHGSLFSGIGGFDLAAKYVGWDNVFHCEYNPFGQRVLNYHFPNSISYNDIRQTDFSIHRGGIDVLSGGFPCQPYSSAGFRLGKADERHLFPEMLRAIKEIKPKWVIGENVRGLISWNEGMVFHEVYDDLEREGYEVQAFLIPAASVNAPHQRYRVWFVANSIGVRLEHTKDARNLQGSADTTQRERSQLTESIEANGNHEDATNTLHERLQRGQNANRWEEPNEIGQGDGVKSRAVCEDNEWDSEFDFSKFPTQPPICGGDDGIPRKLDAITFSKWRKESIMAYGNAIVPQVAIQLFKTINIIENELRAI